MKKLLILAGFFVSISTIYSQVGIGTTTPDPSSLLEVSSTDKGILIPQVSLSDVTDSVLDGVNTAATGLLIFNTNAGTTGGSGIGYYYFNGTVWERLITSATIGDDDWYEVGTTNAPDNINDDKFTFGNLAIGKNTANYPLELNQVDGTITRSLNIYSNYSDTGINSNIFNENNFTGTGTSRGLYNLIGGTGNGTVMALYNNIQNSGSGFHYGLYNALAGSGAGEQRGVYNAISNSGNNLHYGVLNVLTGNGSGLHSGISNQLGGTGNGEQRGIETNIVNSGSGAHYGSYSSLSGAGTGNKYGYYNIINNAAGGTHYGVYSQALKSGSFAGYFLGNLAVGTTGVNTYIFPASRGLVDQIMQTDGSGNISWIDPSSITGDLWNLAGNAGTDGGTNDFIGTTDAVPLTFRTNNLDKVRITTGGQIEVLNTNSSVFMGENSGLSNTGLGNVTVGTNAGAASTTGNYNVIMGYEAGRLLTSDSNNTFVGSFAGYNTDTGILNTFIGSGAGGSNTSGSNNTFLGISAASQNDAGSLNVIIGRATGLYNYDGNNNVYIGYEAGRGALDPTMNASLSNNLYLGHRAGRDATGSNNVFLGYQAGYSETGSNKLFIENSSSILPLIYGEFDNDILRFSGTTYIGGSASANQDLYISNQVVDWDNSNYFLDPAGANRINEVELDDGSAADPSLYFDGDNTTGFYSPATDETAYSINSSEVMRIDNNGNIGIGTPTPNATMDVEGTFKLGTNGNAHSGMYSLRWNFGTTNIPANSSQVLTLAGTSTVLNIPQQTAVSVAFESDIGAGVLVQHVWMDADAINIRLFNFSGVAVSFPTRTNIVFVWQ